MNKNANTIKLIRNAGAQIAAGRGRRRGKTDFWAGVIRDEGCLFSISVAWPDYAEAHEVDCKIKSISTTTRRVIEAEDYKH